MPEVDKKLVQELALQHKLKLRNAHINNLPSTNLELKKEPVKLSEGLDEESVKNLKTHYHEKMQVTDSSDELAINNDLLDKDFTAVEVAELELFNMLHDVKIAKTIIYSVVITLVVILIAFLGF
ncbi:MULTISPECIES: hypothetical protein [unclassified Pseudoalteromonas]|uniref:hypothetical protein n=1 Tax=unclassified Pseudoalteromonas TaxID=194690 RepID=UPI00390C48BF|nr:hypothetical protein [Ningiella sp. W23]